VGICSNCKHWAGAPPDWGLCKKVETSYNEKREVVLSRGPSKAVAVPFYRARFDVVGVIGTLETAADFGCNQFEDRNGKVE